MCLILVIVFNALLMLFGLLKRHPFLETWLHNVQVCFSKPDLRWEAWPVLKRLVVYSLSILYFFFLIPILYDLHWQLSVKQIYDDDDDDDDDVNLYSALHCNVFWHCLETSILTSNGSTKHMQLAYSLTRK